MEHPADPLALSDLTSFYQANATFSRMAWQVWFLETSVQEPEATPLESEALIVGYEHQKVKATHLKRNAYLYIRQSTLRQVFENNESTKRQYDLRQKGHRTGLARRSHYRH